VYLEAYMNPLTKKVSARSVPHDVSTVLAINTKVLPVMLEIEVSFLLSD